MGRRRSTQDYAYARRVMEWTPEAIRQARGRKGWSQAELARALSKAQPGEKGTHPRSITDWETGKATPSGRNLAALERVLGPDVRPVSGELIAWALDEATDMELIAALARRLSRTTPAAVPLPEEALTFRTADSPDSDSPRNTDEPRQESATGREPSRPPTG
jgi:transcriptional regulator with XRE-family HTH domain